MSGKLILIALLCSGASSARAQAPASVEPSTVAVSTGPVYIPLSITRGPWYIGQVVFHGNENTPDFALRGRVRARRGLIYTPSDITADILALTELPAIVSARAEIFALPGTEVPESERTVVVSSMTARIVYHVTEKDIQLPGLTREPGGERITKLKPGVVPAALSAVVMTPTAYRGIDQYNRPGLGLDFNAVYYIGRLYGKNSIGTRDTNFLDRLGVWFLSGDGKMQLQSEGRLRPAVSVGARGYLTFRDAPQPTVATPGVSVNVSADTTRRLSDSYVVVSKKIWKVRSSAGYAQGNAGDRVGLLTEFLSPQLLTFSGHPNAEARSRSVLFASLLALPRADLPLAVELVKPNGMVLNPTLINLKIGYFLKLNFDLSYLRFDGGWDLLGMFQFRYSHFPRTVRVAK